MRIQLRDKESIRLEFVVLENIIESVEFLSDAELVILPTDEANIDCIITATSVIWESPLGSLLNVRF
jgi:hypothetical protein